MWWQEEKRDLDNTSVFEIPKSVIERKWFKEYVGGISCSEEEKTKSLKKINDVIKEKSESIVRVYDFAATYPDSLYLVKAFFDTRLSPSYYQGGSYAPSEYKELGFINQDQYKRAMKEERQNLLEAKLTLLIIYGPILSEIKNIDEINKMLEILGIDIVSFGRVINWYNVCKSDYIDAIKDLDSNYSDIIADLIISDFINSGSTKEDICAKYNIGTGMFQTYVDNYVIKHRDKINIIKQQLKNNSTKRYYYTNDLILMISNYINNGIIFDSFKVPFTMLDYMCLTNMRIEDLISIIKKTNDFKTKEELYASKVILKFYIGNRRLGRVINDSEDILKQKNVFIINNIRIEPTKEDIEDILNLFDKHSIPKLDSLIYTAIDRKVHGYPILPLVENEKENADSYSSK